MKMHHSLTEEKIIAAVEADDYIGFCTFCGAETSGVEPDARNYHCEECDTDNVFGAEELLVMLV